MAESFLSMDMESMKDHTENAGIIIIHELRMFTNKIESFEDCISQLWLTAQNVYNYLLSLNIPLSEQSKVRYQQLILKLLSKKESCQQETLQLVKSMGKYLSWTDLFGDDQQAIKTFSKKTSQLLFDIMKDEKSLKGHLEIILALWIALSSKWIFFLLLMYRYGKLYEQVDIEKYSTQFFNSFKK